jgi:hypothetical protein
MELELVVKSWTIASVGTVFTMELQASGYVLPFGQLLSRRMMLPKTKQTQKVEINSNSLSSSFLFAFNRHSSRRTFIQPLCFKTHLFVAPLAMSASAAAFSFTTFISSKGRRLPHHHCC